jgi:exodeoxyribonuclease VII small subunit
MTVDEIKDLRYDKALEMLRAISLKLENKEVSIDDLTSQVKLANQLTAHCRKRLEMTEKEISKIIRTEED